MNNNWHYICKETLVFSDGNIEGGKYYCYESDTFDYLLNNNDWVQANNAWDELNYILDVLDKMKESNDGELIFIPTRQTAMKIDDYYLSKDREYVNKNIWISTE